MSAHSTIDITELLKQYAKPVFGFSLNRVRNRTEAEDLAQDIMLQLLKSLSARDIADIRHMDAYVWTVAKYTWVHWVRKRSGVQPAVEINGMTEPLEQLLNSEAYRMLRREIAYLSDMQRRIVVMHYYDGMKQQAIADCLRIPVGTVKWHLHDARNEIRKGMNRMQPNGTLSIQPIELTNTGHSGSPGKLGETWNFLRRSLTQNIAYALYHKPLTIGELAVELGTPAHFIEDEVSYLVEYGFLKEAGSNKYSTEFIIWNFTKEQIQRKHALYQESAAQLADLHFEAIMDVKADIEQTSLYYPDRDFNFLLWTLLPLNLEEQTRRIGKLGPDREAVVPIRKDGGQYIAFSQLKGEPIADLGFDPKRYYHNGAMTRRSGDSSLYLWQMDTFWSDRNAEGWRNLTYKDAQLCHVFQQGTLPDDGAHKEDYAYLLAKQYIVKTPQGYKFNAIWVDRPETAKQISAAIPDLSKIFAPVVTKLYEQMLQLAMIGQPKHLEPQIAYMTKMNTANGAIIPYILNHLVDNGKLREPLPEQRKTVTTWMGLIK